MRLRLESSYCGLLICFVMHFFKCQYNEGLHDNGFQLISNGVQSRQTCLVLF